VKTPAPGGVSTEATRVMGRFLRDVMKLERVAWPDHAPWYSRSLVTEGTPCAVVRVSDFFGQASTQ